MEWRERLLLKEREKFNAEVRLVDWRVRMCFHREIILPPMTGRHATRRETLASIAAHHVNLHAKSQHLSRAEDFVGLFGGGRTRKHYSLRGVFQLS